MISKVLFVLFIVYRIYSAINKSKKENPGAPKKRKAKKNLDDVLGDFMKQLENKNKPKPEKVLVNTDMHKAESDKGPLDWQKVSTSKFKEKKQLLNHSDYKNISHHNNQAETIDAYNQVEEEFEFIEVDLQKAVIYNEILNRKYFSI